MIREQRSHFRFKKRDQSAPSAPHAPANQQTPTATACDRGMIYFAPSTICTGIELPKFVKPLNVHTTFFFGVISMNCEFSGPAWQLPISVFPFASR